MYKIERIRFKPMVLFKKDEPVPFEYTWHEVTQKDLQTEMPSNDRVLELIEKMSKDSQSRRYGCWGWRVTKVKE